jgi:membrane protein YdbS with pleckstrin-like domain
MAERTTFQIEASRLIRYFRIRWCFPVAIVFSLFVLSTLPAANGDVFHPAVLTSFAILATVLVSTLVLAPLHVNSLEYWIEGTTLRINQGVVVRKFKSIPLDRVTDIELVQGPLMRACGIWSLRIQTAGSVQQSPEGTIWAACDPESVRDTIVTTRDQAALKSDGAT